MLQCRRFLTVGMNLGQLSQSELVSTTHHFRKSGLQRGLHMISFYVPPWTTGSNTKSLFTYFQIQQLLTITHTSRFKSAYIQVTTQPLSVDGIKCFFNLECLMKWVCNLLILLLRVLYCLKQRQQYSINYQHATNVTMCLISKFKPDKQFSWTSIWELCHWSQTNCT